MAGGFNKTYPLITNEFRIFELAVKARSADELKRDIVAAARHKWDFDLEPELDQISTDQKLQLIQHTEDLLFKQFVLQGYRFTLDRSKEEETTRIEYAGGHIARSRELWGDKYPSYTLIIPQIVEMFPSAAVIYIHRDARDVVASLHRLNWISSLEEGWAIWTAHVLAWMAWKDRIRHLVVRQEDLLTRPEVVVQRLAAFIGVELEVDCWRDFFYKKGPNDDGGAKAIRDLQGRTSHLGYWDNYLCAEQIPPDTRKLMEMLDYPVAESKLRRIDRGSAATSEARHGDRLPNASLPVVDTARSAPDPAKHGRQRRRVLCIGLNKTGTAAIHEALQRLGYRSNHIAPYRFHDAVVRAIRGGEPLLRFLDDWDALQDIWLHSGIHQPYYPYYSNPYFWSHEFKGTILKKLINDYPDLLFVNSVRDFGSWIESRKRHIRYNQRIRALAGRIVDPWLDFIYEECEREYREHQQLVQELFAGHTHRLLTLDVSAGDGYPELCEFLGERDGDGRPRVIPDPFPHPSCSYHETENTMLNDDSCMVLTEFPVPCNLRCSYCSLQEGETREGPGRSKIVTASDYRRLANRIPVRDVLFWFSGNGEPFLYTPIASILKDLSRDYAVMLTSSLTTRQADTLAECTTENIGVFWSVHWQQMKERKLLHETVTRVKQLSRAGISIFPTLVLHPDYFGEMPAILRTVEEIGAKLYISPLNQYGAHYRESYDPAMLHRLRQEPLVSWNVWDEAIRRFDVAGAFCNAGVHYMAIVDWNLVTCSGYPSRLGSFPEVIDSLRLQEVGICRAQECPCKVAFYTGISHRHPIRLSDIFELDRNNTGKLSLFLRREGDEGRYQRLASCSDSHAS